MIINDVITMPNSQNPFIFPTTKLYNFYDRIFSIHNKILPDNCQFIIKASKTGFVVGILQKPMIKTILLSSELYNDSIGKTKQCFKFFETVKSRRPFVSLSFPHTLFIISITYDELSSTYISCELQVVYTNGQIKSFTDLVYCPNMDNIYSDFKVCITLSKIKSDNISDVCNDTINEFWSSIFNQDVVDLRTMYSRQFIEFHSYHIWEFLSKNNPEFINNIDFIPADFLYKIVLKSSFFYDKISLTNQEIKNKLKDEENEVKFGFKSCEKTGMEININSQNYCILGKDEKRRFYTFNHDIRKQKIIKINNKVNETSNFNNDGCLILKEDFDILIPDKLLKFYGIDLFKVGRRTISENDIFFSNSKYDSDIIKYIKENITKRNNLISIDYKDKDDKNNIVNMECEYSIFNIENIKDIDCNNGEIALDTGKVVKILNTSYNKSFLLCPILHYSGNLFYDCLYQIRTDSEKVDINSFNIIEDANVDKRKILENITKRNFVNIRNSMTGEIINISINTIGYLIDWENDNGHDTKHFSLSEIRNLRVTDDGLDVDFYIFGSNEIKTISIIYDNFRKLNMCFVEGGLYRNINKNRVIRHTIDNGEVIYYKIIDVLHCSGHDVFLLENDVCIPYYRPNRDFKIVKNEGIETQNTNEYLNVYDFSRIGDMVKDKSSGDIFIVGKNKQLIRQNCSGVPLEKIGYDIDNYPGNLIRHFLCLYTKERKLNNLMLSNYCHSLKSIICDNEELNNQEFFGGDTDLISTCF